MKAGETLPSTEYSLLSAGTNSGIKAFAVVARMKTVITVVQWRIDSILYSDSEAEYVEHDVGDDSPWSGIHLEHDSVVEFFRNVPKELEEVAFVDGAGYFRTLILVLLPVSMAAYKGFRSCFRY